MDQGPNKPQQNVEYGVPVDKGPYANAPMGVPVAAPAQGQPGYPPQQPYYGQPQPHGGYPPQPPPPGYPHIGQPVQVDAYGRPVVNAVPMQVQPQLVSNNANIRRDAAGNALCNKCSAPYPLPAGCTSWRCRNCHELNNASIYGDECCTIL